MFRGKRVDRDEWVYGEYESVEIDQCDVIVTNIFINGHRVIPTTVGQALDVSDKNRHAIYDDDILLITDTKGASTKARVIFDEGCYCAMLNAGVYAEGLFTLKELLFAGCTLEVIGNIHDNPELVQE